jgi:ribonucleotide reductase alpha subunit
MSNVITPDFVAQYVDKTPPWGFNGMGEIVYRRTYSRDIEALGRKEYWFETIARAINGAQEIGAGYTKEEAERLFDYIFNLKGIFAGRALWQLGTPLVRKMSGVSLVNCLGGETMVPTRQGAKRIDELASIGNAVVMTDNGKWVDAEVRCFGEQPLATIELTRGKQTKFVRATANHIWLKKSDRRVEVMTCDLQLGDKLVSVKGQGVLSVDMSLDGVRHGLVFGDGTVYPQGSRAFIANDSLPELEHLFLEYKYTEVDHGRVYRNLPRLYKSAPSLSESRGYLYGWLSGYFAADGYARSGKSAIISSTNRENLQLVKDVCVLIGIPSGPITNQQRVSNLTGNESTLYNVNLTIDDPEFFLLTKHRGDYDGTSNFNLEWTVKSVSGYSEPEPVYCAVVPDTHTFALEDNLLTHNCWMTTISKVEDFQFLMDHLMVGGGVGFTVERAVVHDLPKIKPVARIVHERTNDADFIVPDSRQGWSALLGKVLDSYFNTGASFSYSTILIRGFGAPLKTFGGTASGPEVLIEGIADICKILDARVGKKIRSVDALDICNIIGKIVVAGSARRSAQIAIGDPDDFLYLRAKNWAKGDIPAWRGNSNNSIFADSYDEIIDEFWKGYDGSGEPYGLINRDLIRKTGRLGEKINDSKVIGTNPCGEIGLEDGEPCNLAEIFLPNIESKEELLDLSRLLYKTQKAITTLDYPYAKSQAVITRNRRLGQGITGWLQATDEQLSWISDCYEALREYDKAWSKELGINASIKLTTVKPSGTLSLLAGVTPGIHPAYSQYYIRRVRMGSSDPLVNYCRDKGYDVQYDIGLDGKENHTVCVVSFPCETPEHAVLAKELTAVDQLNWVVKAQSEWADNNVSVTVYYRKEELPEIQEWMKQNYKDKLKSVSFLLHSDHGFALAPYEEIDKDQYLKMKSKIKNIDFVDRINEYALEDLECEGGACPIK